MDKDIFNLPEVCRRLVKKNGDGDEDGGDDEGGDDDERGDKDNQLIEALGQLRVLNHAPNNSPATILTTTTVVYNAAYFDKLRKLEQDSKLKQLNPLQTIAYKSIQKFPHWLQ